MKRTVLCVVFLAISKLAFSQPMVTERDYRALAQEYAASVEKGLTAQQARGWQRRWREIKRVRCSDGRILWPDHQAEVDSMARAETLAEPGKPAQPSRAARARITARAWLLSERAVRLPERGDPALVAKRILANPEYEKARRKAPESPLAKWLREQWETLARWLRSLTPENPQKSPDLTGAASAIRIFLYVLAGLAVAGGLWLLLRHGSGWRWNRRKSLSPTGGEPDDLTGADIPDPLGAAHAAAARGEYRQAVRLAYIACLRRLRDAALLTLERHRTNWEYQKLLQRRDASVAEQLLPATRLYERIWYGGESATAQDVTLLTSLFSTLPEVPR